MAQLVMYSREGIEFWTVCFILPFEWEWIWEAWKLCHWMENLFVFFKGLWVARGRIVVNFYASLGK